MSLAERGDYLAKDINLFDRCACMKKKIVAKHWKMYTNVIHIEGYLPVTMELILKASFGEACRSATCFKVLISQWQVSFGKAVGNVHKPVWRLAKVTRWWCTLHVDVRIDCSPWTAHDAEETSALKHSQQYFISQWVFTHSLFQHRAVGELWLTSLLFPPSSQFLICVVWATRLIAAWWWLKVMCMMSPASWLR